MAAAGTPCDRGRKRKNAAFGSLFVKRKILWIALAAVLIAGIGGFAYSRRGPKPTEVQVAKVGREDLQAKVTANGKVQAQKKVDISATIPGQITHLAVKEGDQVKKGQFLLQIDADQPPRRGAQHRVLDAGPARRASTPPAPPSTRPRTDLRRARGELPGRDHPRRRPRARTHRRSAPRRPTVQAAERRVEQAGASLEGARDTLAKTTVRSPMDGDRHRPAGRGGRGRRDRRPEQPGHRAPHDLRHVGRRDRDGGGRDLDSRGQASARRRGCGIDAYPNRTFDGVVTEVGSSPILVAGAPTEAIKFKVKVQLKDPPDGDQARPLGAGRHPHRLPRQGAGGPDPGPGACATSSASPARRPRPGAPRDEEGVYLMDDGKARFQPVQDRPARRAVARGGGRPRGRRDA